LRLGGEYFTRPAGAGQRRYEAMRAYFVEDATAAEIADRFGYSTASVHQMATLVRTGKLAPYMAHAHARARRLDRLWVWGRRGEGAQSVAQQLRDQGLPAQAVEDLESAVRDADVISCATTSTRPIVRGAWVSAGSHLDLVGGFRRGMREADDEAIARARIVVDTYAGALAEAADILEPIEHGAITRASVVAELAELLREPARGRTAATDVTLFKSVGTAVADLAAAQLLLDRAA